MITVNDLIISIAAMFYSIGVVTFIILVYFCIHYIVERNRKRQVSYYTRYRQYPSVECCCKECIYFTNVVHHADGEKVGLCELHNRHMYTYNFCFSAKKGDDAE